MLTPNQLLAIFAILAISFALFFLNNIPPVLANKPGEKGYVPPDDNIGLPVERCDFWWSAGHGLVAINPPDTNKCANAPLQDIP